MQSVSQYPSSPLWHLPAGHSYPSLPLSPPPFPDDDFDLPSPIPASIWHLPSAPDPSPPGPPAPTFSPAPSSDIPTSPSPSPSSPIPKRRRTSKAWKEESSTRRQHHAASDAKRRANIAQLHQSLVRLIRARTGNCQLTTQQALEQAVALLERGESLTGDSTSSSLSQQSLEGEGEEGGDGGGLGAWVRRQGGGRRGDEELHSAPCATLLSVSGVRPSVPRPLVFTNGHLRQLSLLMEYAVRHYLTGAAFHPTLPNFRSSPALHSLLSGGGKCGILSTDMVVLDCSHDLSPSEPASNFLFKRLKVNECVLRASDAEGEPPLSYEDLERILVPVVRSMGERFVAGSAQSSPSVLVSAEYPRQGLKVRSLKMMTLVRHADGRPAGAGGHRVHRHLLRHAGGVRRGWGGSRRTDGRGWAVGAGSTEDPSVP